MASALETLCGQAFGAKKYYMLGVYMQRWWVVLFICCVLLFPLYLFASPVLKLLGQPDDVAELSRMVSIWMAPLHFTFTFQFPLKRFLLSQLKNMVIARGSLVALLVHIFVSWLFLNRMHLEWLAQPRLWIFLRGFGFWAVWIRCLWGVSSYRDWLLLGNVFWSLGVCQALCCFWCHTLASYARNYSYSYWF